MFGMPYVAFLSDKEIKLVLFSFLHFLLCFPSESAFSPFQVGSTGWMWLLSRRLERAIRVCVGVCTFVCVRACDRAALGLDDFLAAVLGPNLVLDKERDEAASKQKYRQAGQNTKHTYAHTRIAMSIRTHTYISTYICIYRAHTCRGGCGAGRCCRHSNGSHSLLFIVSFILSPTTPLWF